MAHAPEVLKHAIRDANLLVSYSSLGSPDDVGSLLELAQAALSAGDGEIADDLVRHSALHTVTLKRLGVAAPAEPARAAILRPVGL